MGKLLSGRYGTPPEAESILLSLMECNQKLGMKPSDFVSVGEPTFFEKDFGSSGRYLLFLADAEDVKGKPIWKEGYYLLPLNAKDVLAAIGKRQVGANSHDILELEWEDGEPAEREVRDKALKWGKDSQPLFFKCVCKKLQLKVYEPWALRKRWKARLRCPGKCQPAITTLL